MVFVRILKKGGFMKKVPRLTPILAGKVKGKTIEVWCPYCAKYHTHSWAKEGGEPGFRIAHCTNNIEYNGDYYAVDPVFSNYYIIDEAKGSKRYINEARKRDIKEDKRNERLW